MDIAVPADYFVRIKQNQRIRQIPGPPSVGISRCRMFRVVPIAVGTVGMAQEKRRWDRD